MTTISWTEPTLNVDGSPLAAGEVTGYNIGIRPVTGVAGTYPINVPVVGETAVSEAVDAITPHLAPGSYMVAVQTVGPVNSAFTSELPLVVALPQPQPPGSFTIG